jgi:hypothetical protein
LLTNPHLQEYPQGREKYRDNDAKEIHRKPLSVARSLPDTLPDPGSCRHREYPTTPRVKP